MAWQHATGLRRDYVNDRSKKGKTYEELYGTERANEIKAKQAVHKKGRTYVEMYGEERATELKEVRRARFTGDKHPLWGSSPSSESRKEQSERMMGENNPMYGRSIPVNENALRGMQGRYYGTLFRSSYELAYLVQAFDEGWFGAIVAEPFHWKLTINDAKKTYTPDYMRTDINEVVEIKPQWKLNANHRNCLEKHAHALQVCEANGMTFKVLTEVDLNLPVTRAQKRRLLSRDGVVLFGKKKL